MIKQHRRARDSYEVRQMLEELADWEYMVWMAMPMEEDPMRWFKSRVVDVSFKAPWYQRLWWNLRSNVEAWMTRRGL